jgi:hypothetical protein
MFKIIPFYVFIGLFFGVLVIYALTPPPKVIIKHPTLDNAGKVIYVDNSGVCYKYKKVLAD